MIVTHAGSFHADELMAVALLEKFMFPQGVYVHINPEEEQVKSWLEGVTPPSPSVFFPDGTQDCRTKVAVVRTRTASLLKKATQNSDVFVIDVGGIHNDSALNFDHHQKSMKETWEDGSPLSSTGLVWRYLKTNNLLHLPVSVMEDVELRLIKPLDAHDNGLATFPLSSIVASFNRETQDGSLQDEQFTKALALMKESLENALFSAELKHEATQVLTTQWQKAQKNHDTVVLLQKHIPYHDCAGLLKNISQNQADMIVIPGQGNRFSVISLGLDEPFSIKVPCPASWRGQMDFTQKIKGKDITIKFAHKTGFMCVVEGTHQDALEVGRFIVSQNKPSSKPQSSKPQVRKGPR